MKRVFFDTETTGLKPFIHEIIGYTFQEWDNGVLGRRFTRYILPKTEPDAETRKVNGYNRELWLSKGATPLCEQDIGVWYQFMDNANMAGHNIGFDLDFVQATCMGVGARPPAWSHRKLDTESIGAVLVDGGLIPSSSLNNVAKYFGMARTGEHTSEEDVNLTIAVYEAFLKRFYGLV